ncbi:hypothetical protein [Microbacterium sp.]|jgi:hypothetical protein|uniref:hypothetical protein n=1 Tax=Microbacterium sp. TaxID=51671 RepID=UPI003C7214F2
MSIPSFPAVPPDDDDDYDVTTTEEGGETRLNPDVDDDLVDSAEADRLASGAGSADAKPPTTQEDDPLRAELGENGQGDLAPEDDPETDPSDAPADLRTAEPIRRPQR